MPSEAKTRLGLLWIPLLIALVLATVVGALVALSPAGGRRRPGAPSQLPSPVKSAPPASRTSSWHS